MLLALLALAGALSFAYIERLGGVDAGVERVLSEQGLSEPGLFGDARLVGIARVTDGNSLRIAGERIRLHGIDAPEGRQQCRRASGEAWACGEAATARMAALAEGREVVCAVRERDRYDRLIARCAADGKDVGAALVEEGLAWAYRRFSPDYIAHEERARAAGRGVFDGDNVAPWDWRRGAR